MNHHELEEGSELNLDFTKLKKVANCGEDIIPAVAQDAESGEVLIVGICQSTGFRYCSKRKKMATFWSTSRNELWIKGKTSGDYLELLDSLCQLRAKLDSLFSKAKRERSMPHQRPGR
jgi:phosphoribosyl-AMP cyclohydrolase